MILENTKLINASPDRVWSVTQDIERWPSWTPTMTSVTKLDDAPFEVGCRAKIKQPGQPECEWRVTELNDGTGFTWEARVYGISMSATHELIAHGSGTQNTLRLTMQGILATLLWPLIRPSVKRSLETENTGLKAHCEAL